MPDKTEALQGGQWAPRGSLGGGAEGLACGVDEAQNAQGGVGQRGEDRGQARPLGIVTIRIPAAVLDEVKTVFDLPVVANVGLQRG